MGKWAFRKSGAAKIAANKKEALRKVLEVINYNVALSPPADNP